MPDFNNMRFNQQVNTLRRLSQALRAGGQGAAANQLNQTIQHLVAAFALRRARTHRSRGAGSIARVLSGRKRNRNNNNRGGGRTATAAR
jgi:hypothetical protein